MAERNNSMEVNNTDTESILLDKISANSTPRAVENKISLEDLFILIKTQNSVLKEIDEKFDSLENELKKQNNVRNIKLNQLEEKLDKRINEIQLENKSREIDRLDKNKDKVSGVENYDNINKSMMLENDCVNRSSAVSYTHLDVYKRQIVQYY